jgi:hypothetical protein
MEKQITTVYREALEKIANEPFRYRWEGSPKQTPKQIAQQALSKAEDKCMCHEWDCDICGAKMEADCIKNKSAAPTTQNGWISVEDRLPEYGQKFLVMGEAKGMNPQMGGAYVFISQRLDLKGTLLEKQAERHVEENHFRAQYVTHWQPLPLKPQP